jgi:hypothetical protein
MMMMIIIIIIIVMMKQDWEPRSLCNYRRRVFNDSLQPYPSRGNIGDQVEFQLGEYPWPPGPQQWHP